MPGIPIIDIGPLVEGTQEGERAVAADIGLASRERGFFYVANHGVPETLQSDLFAAAAGFFALDEATKETVSFFKSPHNRGYVPIGGETLDPSLRPDAKEVFNIGRELAPDDPDLLAGTPFHGLNLWPDLPGFRDVTLSYFTAVKRLGDLLHRAFAIDLGLPADYFVRFTDRSITTLRLLHYPPHPGQFDGGQYGASPHTDYGNLTLLAQDDVGGLEVESRDAGWIDAVPIPGTFVCNIGDCLMRWSNDIYVSTPHQVVNRGGRERYSAAFFFDTNADALVDCLPTCQSAERPARYPPVNGADYLRSRLERTYKDGLITTTAPATSP
jgi:isopenicillin N synthase-like dioxygenase